MLLRMYSFSIIVSNFPRCTHCQSGLFSCQVVSDCLQPLELQHARLPCPSLSPWVYSNSCPLSWWCHPTISSSVTPFSSCTQSFPASGSFPWVSSLHQVARVLELRHQSFQWIVRVDFLEGWLVCSPCSPTDSQESSPTPQFKSISSSVLSLLHGPNLTSICNYCKNHNFDCINLCWQRNVSAF